MIHHNHEYGRLETTNRRLVQVSKLTSELHHTHQGIPTISPYCEITIDESVDGAEARYKYWLYTKGSFVSILVGLEILS